MRRHTVHVLNTHVMTYLIDLCEYVYTYTYDGRYQFVRTLMLYWDVHVCNYRHTVKHAGELHL